ncbi:hypothetical protein GCM10011328_24920 [Hafnia psychrotolerans]|uniref:Uncharacterized protein n=1 Tax=Hafnia psychrotolerans TaxID=1477018 RepID=A0ABQ1GRX1_9GAMM|nr:hypothetical protein GCM10011328_24920 [Hafnia psychrotolerans]
MVSYSGLVKDKAFHEERIEKIHRGVFVHRSVSAIADADLMENDSALATCFGAVLAPHRHQLKPLGFPTVVRRRIIASQPEL